MTTLDLGHNSLDALTQAELAVALSAIPAHVEKIILSRNTLFIDKSREEIDALLQAIPADRDVNKHRFILAGENGEPDVARAALPLCAFSIQFGFPVEMVFKILGHLSNAPISGTPISQLAGSAMKMIHKKQAGVLPEIGFFPDSIPSPQIGKVKETKSANVFTL